MKAEATAAARARAEVNKNGDEEREHSYTAIVSWVTIARAIVDRAKTVNAIAYFLLRSGELLLETFSVCATIALARVKGVTIANTSVAIVSLVTIATARSAIVNWVTIATSRFAINF